MSFQGKNIVVTGGASGIGLATVKKLLAAGASVHIIDRASKLPNELKGHDRLFFYPAVDVSSQADVSRAFKSISERSPTLHGLLNIADIAHAEPVACDSDEVMQKVLAVNFWGTWNASTEFFKHAGKAEGGKLSRDAGARVVNVLSVAGHEGLPNGSAYSSSKHAVVGRKRKIAIEWAPLGIQANGLAPGFAGTPMVRHYVKDLPNRTSQGVRKGDLHPDDVADQVLFLMSPQSSGFAGSIMEVTGGIKRARPARI